MKFRQRIRGWRRQADRSDVGQHQIGDREGVVGQGLLDVPAELFLDMLAWTITGRLGSSGILTLAGQRHDLDALRGTPVLTIEAGTDGLVGPGQTHVLAGLLPGVRSETLPGAEHHELFTGPDFARTLPPLLRRFHEGLAC